MKASKTSLFFLVPTLCFLLLSLSFYCCARFLPSEPTLPTKPSHSTAPVSKAKPEELLLSLNSATVDELSCLPGIGDLLAQRIADYRREHGPFTSLEELLQIEDIGPGRLELLRNYLTLEDGS